MMPAVMMAPVGMGMARAAMMANDTRAMHGQYPAAATSSDKGGSGIDGRIVVVVGVAVWVVVVIDATHEHPAEAVPVAKAVPGKSRTSCDDRRCNGSRSGTERAAANGGPTETTATAASPTTSSTTVSTANFNREPIDDSVAGSSTSRMDRRQRLRALAGGSR
jgi:hypothetical protein